MKNGFAAGAPQSVRFTLVTCTATRTSPGPTSGAGTSVRWTTSGGSYVVRTAALMVLTVTIVQRLARRLPGIRRRRLGDSATGSTGQAGMTASRPCWVCWVPAEQGGPSQTPCAKSPRTLKTRVRGGSNTQLRNPRQGGGSGPTAGRRRSVRSVWHDRPPSHRGLERRGCGELPGTDRGGPVGNIGTSARLLALFCTRGPPATSRARHG